MLQALKDQPTQQTVVKIPSGTDMNNMPDSKPKMKVAEESPFEILKNEFDGLGISKNSITRSFEKDGERLTEQQLASIFIDLFEQHKKVKGFTKQAYDIFLSSDKIITINPLTDYLKGLQLLQSTELIKELVSCLLLKPHEYFETDAKAFFTNPTYDFTTLLLKKWLVGIVAGIFKGNYNSLMPVLVGPKNTGKTEFFRRLLPKALSSYFAQSKFNDGKDSEALMCEMLLILNDELDGMNKKDAKTFRNFISQNAYTYRPPYGKQNITAKRLASVCGTSNDTDIIDDPENNRRIIPIEIIEVDYKKYNQIDKDQLFAEVFSLYKAGFDWNLSREDINLLNLFNKGFEAKSIERELIIDNFIPSTPDAAESEALQAKDILKRLTERSMLATKISFVKIGKEMTSIGFKQRSARINGCPVRVYDCIDLRK